MATIKCTYVRLLNCEFKCLMTVEILRLKILILQRSEYSVSEQFSISRIHFINQARLKLESNSKAEQE